MSSVFNCKCCAKEVRDLSQYVETRYGHFMSDNSFCYCCSYWNLLVAEANVYVCDKSIIYKDFTFMRELPPGGEGVKYKTLGDQVIHRSNNLWPIARLPAPLRALIKPNIQILLSELAVA